MGAVEFSAIIILSSSARIQFRREPSALMSAGAGCYHARLPPGDPRIGRNEYSMVHDYLASELGPLS
jgi:hypothetical protein